MLKYIQMLQILIQKYVFITSNVEKANVFKAREAAKQQLLEIKTALQLEIDKINE